jgi:hypothetical protein
MFAGAVTIGVAVGVAVVVGAGVGVGAGVVVQPAANSDNAIIDINRIDLFIGYTSVWSLIPFNVYY